MVTTTQLQSALQTISQMNDVLQQLRDTVQFALDGKVAGVVLDATVIASLQAQYLTLKTQLSTLFAQLP